MIRKYLSSLRSTYIFMTCFGLLMGAVFPFYSWLFFGVKAFSPLYVFGCLTAGFVVGSFCYHVIKEVLKLYVERQLAALGKITGDDSPAPITGKADELQQLMECNEALINRVLVMVENVSALASEVSTGHRRLLGDFTRMLSGNERQALRGKDNLDAVDNMNLFFNDLMKEIEFISARTDERASISTRMSSATDDIALNIKEYSALVMETSVSIEEMAASIRETTASTGALASSTEKTYNSINAIGAATADVRDRTRRSSECSEKVMLQAQNGMAAMAATIATMIEIEGSTDRSVQAINRLSHHSRRVGEIVDMIKEVVDQTTLLSLNASILAAQAGEKGNAFAVVAEEIRSLAQRTSASTDEIEEMVRNIQRETTAAERAAKVSKEKVAEGVAVSERTSDSLKMIESSAAEASRMAHEIAAAADEQASESLLITQESENNLERVKQLTTSISEEEKGAGLILRTLERMREFTVKVTASTEDQARGNRLYMKSVVEDSEKVKGLKDTCQQQIAMGDLLRNEVTEVGRLMQANADEAKRIMAEVETINLKIVEIQREMAAFRQGEEVTGEVGQLAAPSFGQVL